MILLHIDINNEGDISKIGFKTVNDLIEYLSVLNDIKMVYLFAELKEGSEILVTGNVEKAIGCIICDFWDLCLGKNSHFVVFGYSSYEEAYENCLDMMEGNPNCYKK